jgi:outer membrane lipoprotein-sorting protein
MLKTVMKVWMVVLAALLATPEASVAAGRKVQSIEITPEIQDTVTRINAFFNSFQTMRGKFIQTNPKGSQTRGVMHLAKPGKLRFEYEAPNPLLIASDGKWLTIKNKVKEKGDQVPLSKTPFRLIVAQKLDLLKEAAVIGFEQKDGFSTVALTDKGGSLSGQIILVFDDQANALSQWIIVDGKGQRTTVQLSKLEKDVKIDPKLFAVTIKREEN